MNKNNTNKEGKLLLDLSIASSVIFIITSLVSLALTFDDRGDLFGGKTFFSKKQSLDISYYNRIVIIVAVLISLYVGYNNYKNEDEGVGKYKSGLLLSTNVLSVIGAVIILYVSYLNRQEQSLTVSDVENPLI